MKASRRVLAFALLLIAPLAMVQAEDHGHGHHMMLEQLNKPLAEGERVPVTLQFRGGQTLQVELQVRSLDAAEPMDHSGMKH